MFVTMKLVYCGLLQCLCILVVVGLSRPCLEPFVGLDGGCYYFHTQPATFTKSVELCQEKGAILAQIDSAEEEQALTQYIEAQGMPKRKQNQRNGRKRNPTVLTPQELTDQLKYYHATLCPLEAFGLLQPSLINILQDKKVPWGKEDRAILTTPPGFSIRNSSIPNGGLGAWTDMFIPRSTVLGFYEGVIVPADTIKDASYAWFFKGTNKGIYAVDSADPTNSNWLRYVNSPRTDAEENLIPVNCNRKVFYVVPRSIAPKTELMISYGINYDEQLGIMRNHPDDEIPDGSWQIRIGSIHVGTDFNLTHPDGSTTVYSNFRRPVLRSPPLTIKLLLSQHKGEWAWAKEEDYTFYTNLRDGYSHYPFICEKKISTEDRKHTETL